MCQLRVIMSNLHASPYNVLSRAAGQCHIAEHAALQDAVQYQCHHTFKNEPSSHSACHLLSSHWEGLGTFALACKPVISKRKQFADLLSVGGQNDCQQSVSLTTVKESRQLSPFCAAI